MEDRALPIKLSPREEIMRIDAALGNPPLALWQDKNVDDGSFVLSRTDGRGPTRLFAQFVLRQAYRSAGAMAPRRRSCIAVFAPRAKFLRD
jgi:hypothetical protein